jgi:hypothetical protein
VTVKNRAFDTGATEVEEGKEKKPAGDWRGRSLFSSSALSRQPALAKALVRSLTPESENM